MSNINQTVQRVLDLDREETPGETRVSVYDDKYMFIVRSDSSMEVLRYGETWWTPDRGANAVRSLVHFADERRTEGIDLARALVAERARVADLERQLAALTDERDDLKAQRDAMRADVPVDEQLLGHLAMTGIAKSHDAYKAQKRAEAERDEANARIAEWQQEAASLKGRLESAQIEANAVRNRHDALRADLARVTAERDDAMTRAERFAKYVDAVAPLSPAPAKESPAPGVLDVLAVQAMFDRHVAAATAPKDACQAAIAAEERGELSPEEAADIERTADAQIREALERIARQHHTDHCIARQAWGDGECECGPALRDVAPDEKPAPKVAPVKFDEGGYGLAANGEIATFTPNGWEAELSDHLAVYVALRPGEDAGDITARMLAAVGRSV